MGCLHSSSNKELNSYSLGHFFFSVVTYVALKLTLRSRDQRCHLMSYSAFEFAAVTQLAHSVSCVEVEKPCVRLSAAHIDGKNESDSY